MYTSQPAIDAAIDRNPIGVPGEGVASFICQDKHLLVEGGIVRIGCGQGKDAAVRAYKEGPIPRGQVGEIEPERGISEEGTFLFFLRGAEDLQRFVGTGCYDFEDLTLRTGKASLQ